MDFVNLISIGIIGLVGAQVLKTNSNPQAQVIIDSNKVKGVIKFEQTSQSNVTIEVNLEGLGPGASHGFHIHAIPIKPSDSCDLAGPHFDLTNSPHGGPHQEPSQRHIGDLGNILADSNGRVQTKFSDYLIKLTGPESIINKTLVIHESQDDLKTIESSGKRIACGLIVPIV